MVTVNDECSQGEDSCSSTDTEDYLDLADLNDFQDCDSTIQHWQETKIKLIETLIANGCDASSFKDFCYGRGGLLNGNLFLILYL